MIRLYEKNNISIYRDFEDFLFTYPELHNVVLDFENDKCTIDNIEYRISSLENPILDTFTIQDYIFTSTDESTDIQYFGAIKRTKDKSLIMKVSSSETLFYVGLVENFNNDWNNRVELTFNQAQNIEL